VTLSIRLQDAVNVNAIEDIKESVEMKLVVSSFILILMVSFSIFRIVWDVDVGSVTGKEPVSPECFGRIHSYEHFGKNTKKKL
jgi:hypothetical protein